MRYVYQFWSYDDSELVAFDLPDSLVNRFNKLLESKPIIWGDSKAVEVRGRVTDPIKYLKKLKKKTYNRKFYEDTYNYYRKIQESENHVMASGSFDIRAISDSPEQYADYMMEHQKDIERKNKRIDKLIRDIQNEM